MSLVGFARNLCNPDYVRRQGATRLVKAYCVDLANTPQDARSVFARIADLLHITKEQKLSGIIDWGPELPPSVSPVAGLTLLYPERAVGHWVATVPLNDGTYVQVDNDGITDVPSPPPVNLWVWWKPEYANCVGGAKIKPALTRSRVAKNVSKKKSPASGISKRDLAAVAAAVESRPSPPKYSSTPASKTPIVPPPSASAPAPTAKMSPVASSTPVSLPSPTPAVPAPTTAATDGSAVEAIPPAGPSVPPVAAPLQAGPKSKKDRVASRKRQKAEVAAAGIPAAVAPTHTAAAGRPRNNQCAGFTGVYTADTLGGDVRDRSLAASAGLLRALVQGLWPTVTAPPRPASPPLAQSVWELLFAPTANTVSRLRAEYERALAVEAPAAVGSVAPLFSIVSYERALRFMCESLPSLGFDAERVKDATNDFKGFQLPLAAKRSAGYPSVILVAMTTGSSPSPKAVDLAGRGGTRGFAEACLLTKTDNSTCYPVAVVRQRISADSCAPAPADGYTVYDLDKKSAIMSLGNAVSNMGPTVNVPLVLFRVTKAGILAAATEPRAQAAMREKREQQSSPEEPEPQIDPVNRLRPDAVASDFHQGRRALPASALLLGDFFSRLKLHPYATHCSITWHGKSYKTRRRHWRELARLKKEMESDLLELPLGEALAWHYQRRRVSRSWEWQTLHREMTNLHGAMTDVSIYSTYPDKIRLSENAAWTNALRFAQQRMQENQPEMQTAATFEQIDRAVHLCPDLQVSAAIMFAWMAAGRLGDITQMLRREVVFTETRENSKMFQVTFCVRRGKGVTASQPYTVNSLCPPHWRTALTKYLDLFEDPLASLFHRPDTASERKLSLAITSALRAVHSTLTQRSMRRGSLQAMAADPSVTATTLMSFSGHRNEQTLRRYLDWGREFANLRELAHQAAKNLFSMTSPTSNSSPPTTSQ